jgi:hypothetical protein
MNIMGFVHPRGKLEAIEWMWREKVFGVCSPLAASDMIYIPYSSELFTPIALVRQKRDNTFHQPSS